MPHPSSIQRLVFRCLDSGHLISEERNVRGPLAPLQTSWCVTHDSPAVAATTLSSDAADGVASAAAG